MQGNRCGPCDQLCEIMRREGGCWWVNGNNFDLYLKNAEGLSDFIGTNMFSHKMHACAKQTQNKWQYLSARSTLTRGGSALSHVLDPKPIRTLESSAMPSEVGSGRFCRRQSELMQL